MNVKSIAFACCPSALKPMLNRIENSPIGYRLAKGVFWSMADNATAILRDKEAYAAMANAVNPYDDGKACGRIAKILKTISLKNQAEQLCASY